MYNVIYIYIYREYTYECIVWCPRTFGGRKWTSVRPISLLTLHPTNIVDFRGVRGWRHTVEIVLFEISNSMKPYPSVVHAYGQSPY